MALFAIAVPILPGQTGEWRQFVDQLNGTRNQEFVESRHQLQVRERTFYQSTPNGDLVIVTLEGDDPVAAFQAFAKRDDEFTRWFVEQVIAYHGLDLRQPPPELIVDSGPY